MNRKEADGNCVGFPISFLLLPFDKLLLLMCLSAVNVVAYILVLQPAVLEEYELRMN